MSVKKFSVCLGVWLGIAAIYVGAQQKQGTPSDASRTVWPAAFQRAEIPSSVDGARQAAYFLSAPATEDKKPLVVSLHAWSFGFEQDDPIARRVLQAGWNYIRPDFRGANRTPDACLSRKALSDIDDAIAYAKARAPVDERFVFVAGVSGGGLATLGTYMRSRHDVRLFLAWVPISDLAAWYGESVQRKNKYAQEILAVTSSKEALNAEEARRRSPLFMGGPIMSRARLEMYAGIHDGHTGSVPVSQSLRFFNRLAGQYGRADAQVSEKEIASLLNEIGDQGATGKIDGRAVVFHRDIPQVSVTLFEGSHEMLAGHCFLRMKETWEAEHGQKETARTSQAAGPYAPPFETAVRSVFLSLPPGAIEPQGWLRDWAVSIKDGYTACMDDVDDEFKRAWTSDFKPTGENLSWPKGAWPFEGGAYWFDGMMKLGLALRDDALLEQARRRLYAVVDNMNAATNGILFFPWLDRNNPEDWKALDAADGFPVGKAGLLGATLLDLYTATGDKNILSALEKAYVGEPSALLRAKWRTTHLFPSYATYVWSGDPGIAAALDTMFRDGCTGVLPARSRFYASVPGSGPDRTSPNAHGVMFLQHLATWAVGTLWTGNTNYLNAALGWDDWLNRVALQPYGVPVSDEWYHPTGAFRGSETCDVAMYLEVQRDLLLLTGDAKRADRMERAFFNAGPAVFSRDCKAHVYFQSPNRFAAGSPEFPDGPRGSGCDYKRKHAPLCCTAALNRILPDYLSNMWLATRDSGLAAICYGPCHVTALVADRVQVKIHCTTDYPFNETIEMTFDPDKPATFPVNFHIPGWCARPEIAINGRVCQAAGEHGFLRIERDWKKGDAVRLRFPMVPKVEKGRDTSLELAKSPSHKPVQVGIPDPAGIMGKPYAAVSYGPLLFALPIPDTTDDNTPAPASRWKFALNVQNPAMTVVRTPMPARWDWPSSAPLKVTVNAMPIDWTPDRKNPSLPQAPVAATRPSERIALVPYGCTKFRISMFPVTGK